MFFLLCLALAGCGHERPAAPPAPQPVSAEVREVRSTKVASDRILSGALRARRSATLSTRLSGRIQFLRVDEGDRVSPGETLVRVDTGDLDAQAQQAVASEQAAVAAEEQARVAIAAARHEVSAARTELEAALRRVQQARARWELARVESRRWTTLAAQGAVAKQRGDQAATDERIGRAQLQEAEAAVSAVRVRQARALTGVQEALSAASSAQARSVQAGTALPVVQAHLQYGEIKAPFAGLVVDKLAHEGEVTAPGKPLLRIEDTTFLELSVEVPETEVERIQPRQQLQVELPALGKTFPGRVRRLITSTDPSTHNFQARIDLENRGQALMPGMFARIRLPQKASSRIFVPLGSLLERGGLEGVMVVDEQGKAEFRLLRTGERTSDRVEVLSGLRDGERFIVNPGRITEGTPVR